MDNVCHTLVGAAFGEAGLKHRTRYGAAVLMISANIPDLDVLVFFTGMTPVAFRRGITHGVVAQLLLPLLLTGAFMLIAKLRPPKKCDEVPPLRPVWLLLLAVRWRGLARFLDWLNNYGVRLLTPFNWRWFSRRLDVHRRPVAVARDRGLACGSHARRHVPAPARGALLFAAGYILVMVLGARGPRHRRARLARHARCTAGRIDGRPRARLAVQSRRDRRCRRSLRNRDVLMVDTLGDDGSPARSEERQPS